MFPFQGKCLFILLTYCIANDRSVLACNFPSVHVTFSNSHARVHASFWTPTSRNTIRYSLIEFLIMKFTLLAEIQSIKLTSTSRDDRVLFTKLVLFFTSPGLPGMDSCRQLTPTDCRIMSFMYRACKRLHRTWLIAHATCTKQRVPAPTCKSQNKVKWKFYCVSNFV